MAWSAVVTSIIRAEALNNACNLMLASMETPFCLNAVISSFRSCFSEALPSNPASFGLGECKCLARARLVSYLREESRTKEDLPCAANLETYSP